jgi:hypothetical protein
MFDKLPLGEINEYGVQMTPSQNRNDKVTSNTVLTVSVPEDLVLQKIGEDGGGASL